MRNFLLSILSILAVVVLGDLFLSLGQTAVIMLIAVMFGLVIHNYMTHQYDHKSNQFPPEKRDSRLGE